MKISRIFISTVIFCSVLLFACQPDLETETMVHAQDRQSSTPTNYLIEASSGDLTLLELQESPLGELLPVPYDYELRYQEVVSSGLAEAYLFQTSLFTAEVYAVDAENQDFGATSFRKKFKRKFTMEETGNQVHYKCKGRGKECSIYEDEKGGVTIFVQL